MKNTGRTWGAYLLDEEGGAEILTPLEAESPRGVIVANQLHGHQLRHGVGWRQGHCTGG